MTPEQRRMRAVAARTLLDDGTLQSAWAEIEADLRKEWEACWLPRKRDRIWSELKHLKALRHRLATYSGHMPRD